MTNELMTTLIVAGLIIIQLMVTMLIKKVRTATASAGVTIHLWKAMVVCQAGESDSRKGRHVAHSFGGATYVGEFKNTAVWTHYT